MTDLLRTKRLRSEIDERVRRRRVELGLDIKQLRDRRLGVQEDRERHVERLIRPNALVDALDRAVGLHGLADKLGEANAVDLGPERASPDLAARSVGELDR